MSQWLETVGREPTYQYDGTQFNLLDDATIFIDFLIGNHFVHTISIQNYTRTKIGPQSGFDASVVTFRSDVILQSWEARAGGSGPGQGLLVGTGTEVAANTDQQFTIDDEELTAGDGPYRINVYGKNTAGDWSAYG